MRTVQTIKPKFRMVYVLEFMNRLKLYDYNDYEDHKFDIAAEYTDNHHQYIDSSHYNFQLNDDDE